MIGLGIVLGFCLYGLMVLSQCYFRVGEGHVAVLTTFGAVERAGDVGLRTYGPGLHRKRAWQKVVMVPTMEQSVDLSGEKGGQMAMAEDGTVLRFDSILRYQPIEARLEEFLFGLRAPIEHITGLFTCLLRNEIANFRAEGSLRSDLARADLSAGGGAYALIRRERVALDHDVHPVADRPTDVLDDGDAAFEILALEIMAEHAASRGRAHRGGRARVGALSSRGRCACRRLPFRRARLRPCHGRSPRRIRRCRT